MERYYLDTCVWLDLYEKRGVRSEHALRFVRKIIMTGALVCISDAHLHELKSLGYTPVEIAAIFNHVSKSHLRHVHIRRDQISEAKRIASRSFVSLRDALHAIIAREHQAVLVSVDADFERLRAIAQAFRPEELS